MRVLAAPDRHADDRRDTMPVRRSRRSDEMFEKMRDVGARRVALAAMEKAFFLLGKGDAKDLNRSVNILDPVTPSVLEGEVRMPQELVANGIGNE